LHADKQTAAKLLDLMASATGQQAYISFFCASIPHIIDLHTTAVSATFISHLNTGRKR
jgi:hypothetical protein